MTWLLIILFSYTLSAAAAPVDIATLQEKTKVSKQFEILQEPIADMQVLSIRQEAAWLPLESGAKSFTLGITDRAFWARAVLKNSSTEAKSFYLVSEDPRTDQVDFYVFDQDRLLIEKHTGDHKPFASRGFFYRGFAFPLNLEAGASLEVYLRFQSTAPVEIDMHAYPPGRLESEAATAGHAGTLYFGAMASIILFNFLLFVSSRERIYLLYCLFQLVTAGAISIAFGSAYGLLWPESPKLNAVMSILLPCLAPALALVFTASYLGLKDKQKSLWWLLQIMAALQGLAGVIGAFNSSHLIFMQTLYSGLILGPSLVLAISVTKALNRDRSAILFLIAWVPLLMGALAFALVRLGFGFSFIPQGAELAFGSIWEAVFLSVCLGDKFNQLKKQEFIYLQRIRDEELHTREAELLAESRRREKLIHEREAAANRNLVRVICHDLANPLNIILNYSYIFEQPNMKWEDARRLLKKMHHAALHQQEIIEHVRDFEAINSGKSQLHLTAVSLKEAVAQLRDLMQKGLEEKQIRFNCQGLDKDLLVMAEQRSLVYNVLANLLSNAIKFSPDGSEIRLDVLVLNDSIELTLSDQGIGMDQELLDKIFDISSPTTRPGLKGEKGTGFGLPIVKSYVERYEGELKVESTSIEENAEQHGTRFILTLKRGIATVAAA